MEKSKQTGHGKGPAVDEEGPVASPQVEVNTAMVKEQHPFWSKSIKNERRQSAKGMLMGMLLITAILWIALPIFWGSVWLLLRYFNQLTVTVVDFESPLLGQDAALGPLMVSMARETNMQTMRPHLGFAITQASDYPNGPVDVKEAIGYSQYWGAIVVYPNCTSTWRTALQNGIASYDPTGCVGVFYSGARYYQVTLLYLAPFMKRFAEQVVQQASTSALAQYVESIQTNTTALSLLAQVPQAVSTPFSLYQEDVRPINQWAVAAPFEAALIYYLILTFTLSMWGAAAREKTGWNKKLTLPSLYLWRIGVPFLCYFLLSLSMTLQIKAFLIPTEAAFGRGGGFMALWMLNWVFLCAVGFVLESMISLLTKEYVPFFLIIWIIMNISSSFQPIELMEKFYRFLRWLPFYHTVEAYKIIFYKTRPPHEIGLNYGALIAVAAVAQIGNFLFLLVERRREQKEMKQQQDK
ncbi:hypothetical protein P389DRAFT_73734 [Cystobasidium minutum MCA 4210]|uniref:uncharacterized protein n=1 Tax=Cystobasidium minutum MCA 4210 TaxID=1397322 RepID=UPI0034CD0AF5|eukprot:jgi/Rhomi1/73734/CE73733_940